MCDIFTIRTYIIKMCYLIYDFIDNIINLSNIKMSVIAFIAHIIKWYKEFYTLNEIYRLDISNNTINKHYFSTLYFNILYTCYNYPLLYPFYYILFIINPILSSIYVLNVKYNNRNYKLIVDNRNNYNLDMIFKYEDYILTNEVFDMKYINLKCNYNSLNSNNEIININQYVFNNIYQTLNYILIDINSDYNILNYLLPLNIEITDLIDDTVNISFEITNEIINLNISTICEQYILNNSFDN